MKRTSLALRRKLLVLALTVVAALGALPAPASASPNGIVISEFRVRGPNGASDEFVELLNTAATPRDISGYKLQGCASVSGDASDRTTVPAGTPPLQPGEHFLFVNKAMAGFPGDGDAIYTTGFADFTTSNQSGTRITDPAGLVIDQVGSPRSPCREGGGLVTPTANGDQSFERASGGSADSDNNPNDFSARASDPQRRDQSPSLSIGDATVTEGSSGSANATFTVTLSRSTAQPVTVQYATADNTATAGQDYTPQTGTLTFAPGDTSETVVVPVLGDTVEEGAETFFVNLSGPTNSTLADAQGLGTIDDDEGVTTPATPTISVDDQTVPEGDGGSSNATFTITLSAASQTPVTVEYATANGTATAGRDYTPQTGTLVFAPGDTSETVVVPVLGDRDDEPNETFFVNLSNPSLNATVSDGQGQGTITDEDPPLTRIHDIQGAGGSSPQAGRTVTIEGIVTGVDDEIGANFQRTFPEDAGIYVQEEPTDADNDERTSEGIFVGFVRNRQDYPPGTRVRVNGAVREKFGQTIISETVNQEPVIVGAAALPDPVTLDESRAEAQDPDSRPYYEQVENMRVRLAVGTANSGGTNKFDEAFLTQGTERDRVFRNDIVPDLLATDADGAAGDPNNPFRNPIVSSTRTNVDLFDQVDEAIGPFGFSFSNFKIIVQADRVPLVTKGPTEYPYSRVAPQGPKQVRVASFNLLNFFPPGQTLDLGTVDNAEFEQKRERLADAIDRLLKRPDVISVQEAFDKPTLDSLATRLGGYTAHLIEGNDERGIDVGFLVKDTAKVSNVRQLGKDARSPNGVDCADGTSDLLFDRPPLAADIVAGELEFTVIGNHFASKGNPPACPLAQAEFVRDQVRELEGAGRQVIVNGDLNSFEDEPPLAALEDGTTTLTNQWPKPPAEERYSFQFSGRLQTLDHTLITDGLEPLYDDFLYTHFDNDYFERARGGGAPPPPQPDPRDGHKVSDHDPMLLTLHQPVRSAEAPRGGGNEESRSGGGSTGDSGGEVAGETRSSLPPRLLPPRLFGLRVLGVPRTCAGDFVARIGLLNALSPFVRISLDGDPLERSRRAKEAVRIECDDLRPGLHRLVIEAFDRGRGRAGARAAQSSGRARIRRTYRFRVRAAQAAPRFLG